MALDGVLSFQQVSWWTERPWPQACPASSMTQWEQKFPLLGLWEDGSAAWGQQEGLQGEGQLRQVALAPRSPSPQLETCGVGQALRGVVPVTALCVLPAAPSCAPS